MRRGDTIEDCRRRHRERAGEKAYKRFADAMAEFRAAIAEIPETSKPDMKSCNGFEEPEARLQRHKKIITRLRANGYRPLNEMIPEKV